MNVRIIAGSLKGATLITPTGHKTHPMSEKLRSVIFNVLGDIEGLEVLDAFAGSGAIGLEAASRGASKVTLLDNDKKAQDAIQANIGNHKVTIAKLTKAPLFSWSQNNPDATFDIVFADPPFDDLQQQSLEVLPRHLKQGGVLVLNFPTHLAPPDYPSIKLVKQKVHGTAQVCFYKYV